MRDNFKIDGNTVTQSELHFNGLGNIESIGAERIQAHIERGELLERKLHIRKLTMEEGNVTLRFEEKQVQAPTGTRLSKPTSKKEAENSTKKRDDNDLSASGSSSRLTPENLQLDFAECRDANFILHHNQ